MTHQEQEHHEHDQSEFKEWLRRNRLLNSKPIKAFGPMGTEHWQQLRQLLILDDEELS